MTKTYEMVLVFDPALEMEQLDGDLRKLQEVIAANGFARRWERWGKRRLAYEIRGKQYGYYVLCVFDQDTAQVGELDRLSRIFTNVIRHLITEVPKERVPEVDEESVKTLGTVAVVVAPAPPEEIEAAVAVTNVERVEEDEILADESEPEENM